MEKKIMPKKKAQSSKLPLVSKEWVPVRQGRFFCSPACRCRCLLADNIRATKGATLLLKKLKGMGWQSVVWENLGWHFKAVSGPLTVFGDYLGKDGTARYSCTMSGQKPDNFTSSDPNEAVAHTLDYCLAVADKALGHLYHVLGPKRDQ